MQESEEKLKTNDPKEMITLLLEYKQDFILK